MGKLRYLLEQHQCHKLILISEDKLKTLHQRVEIHHFHLEFVSNQFLHFQNDSDSQTLRHPIIHRLKKNHYQKDVL